MKYTSYCSNFYYLYTDKKCVKIVQKKGHPVSKDNDIYGNGQMQDFHYGRRPSEKYHMPIFVQHKILEICNSKTSVQQSPLFNGKFLTHVPTSMCF